MAATVRLLRSGISFAVTDRETILQAALRAGIDWPFSCQSGTCRTCIARVVAGEVTMDEEPDLAIGPREIAAGWRLLCIGTPRTPLIEIDR
jgi:ferredoxin